MRSKSLENVIIVVFAMEKVTSNRKISDYFEKQFRGPFRVVSVGARGWALMSWKEEHRAVRADRQVVDLVHLSRAGRVRTRSRRDALPAP